MAQHRATIEEAEDAFDDDFDLPLPPRPFPSSTSSSSAAPGILSGSATSRQTTANPGVQIVNDASQYKTWTCVYPIYIDAKQPYGTGRRRVAREKSCWWPHSQLLADAARGLQLPVFHEPTKCHPRDWENPGRVKILFKEIAADEGAFLEKQLLEAISAKIQQQHASQIPLPDQIKSSPRPKPGAAQPGSSNVSKLSKSSKSAPMPPSRKSRPKAPKPPEPFPLIDERYGGYSPLIEAGILVNTVKVALKQQKEDTKKAPEPSLANSAAGKGKRKVVRVRA